MAEWGHVLVVDDDADTRAFLSRVLTGEGYTVSLAVDGLSALRQIGSETTRPDLVLLDLHLPVIAGDAVLVRARGEVQTRHLPIIVLTGYRDAGHVVACLDAGASDYVSKPVEAATLLARVRSRLRLARESADWRHASDIDPVTQLANRRAFHRALERSVHLASRTGQQLAVVFLDLDGFKQVNDRHGHVVGDQVLRCVAHGIGAALRRCDIAGRWGGDEFVLALPGSAPDAAREVVERIRAAVHDRMYERMGLQLGISAGLANLVYDVRTDDPHACGKLVEAADRAMYRDKRERTDPRPRMGLALTGNVGEA